MSERGVPSFEEWVEYCFTRGCTDSANWSEPTSIERLTTFVHGIHRGTLVSYMTRFFEAPGFAAERFDDEQLGRGVWFIFGGESEYFWQLLDRHVPATSVVRCVSAIETLYTELLDRVCGRRGTEPDSPLHDSARLDMAVYMMWDRNGIDGVSFLSDAAPVLSDAAVGVLETALTKCRTSACRLSALHGIADWAQVGGPAFDHHRDRLIRMVDAFVAVQSIPAWLRDYAFKTHSELENAGAYRN